MKKTITTLTALAAMGAAALQADELSISSTFGWESEYVFRGLQFAKSNFQPVVDFSYEETYVGFWSMLPVQSRQSDDMEFNFYGGYTAALDHLWHVDVGATVYYFPNFVTDSTRIEAYIGGALDLPFSPAVYVFYDFDDEVWTVEGSAGYSHDLGEGYSFDLGVHLGHSWISDVWRGSTLPDYFYGGVSAGVSQAFTDHVHASAGGRFTFNDLSGAKQSNVWWGVSLTAGF